jgi:Peptidase A4 family
MKPFSKVRISLFRATHTSSNAHVFGSPSPSKGKRRLMGVVAVMLGIAMSGVLASGQVHAGSPDSRQPDASAVARARAAFLKYMSSHRPMVRSGVAPLAAVEGTTSQPSVNWSGFADAESGAKTVSSVSGEWVMPYVQCPGGNYKYQDAFLANWVGIDGFPPSVTVEQLGTGAQCFEGVTYYYVWYEMYPAGTVVEGTQACINNNVDCPQPGDRVAASVTVTAGGNYTLSLTDFNRPQESFSVKATCDPSTCLDSSAEWIVERPATELPPPAPPGLIQILPLVDYFQTGFFNGTLTSGGKTTKIEQFQDGTVNDVPMVDDTGSYFLDCVGQREFGPQLLQTPNGCPTVSPIHGSFNVTWDSSF